MAQLLCVRVPLFIIATVVLVIVEEEAVVVRSIYDMFLAGKTIRYIADFLTSEGIPTPRGKSKWSVSTIRSILTNEKYKGDAILQKTYVVDFLTKETRVNHGEKKQYLVENSHDPIIAPETYDKVQEQLTKRLERRNWSGSQHPFANRLICATCGQFYGHKV